MTYSTPGGPRTYRVTLKADGDKVTGTVQRPTSEVPLTGEIRRDSVFFTQSIVYNDSPLAMNVAAKVKESKRPLHELLAQTWQTCQLGDVHGCSDG